MSLNCIIANAVGYANTSEMKAGKWYICGMNFETVSSQPIKIKDLFCDANLVKGSLTAGSTTADSSVIQIPDGKGGYVYYYYDQAADFDWSKDPPEIPGWVKLGDEGSITEDSFKPGEGFWFKNPGSDIQVTFAGQVLAVGTKDITVGPTWIIAANPFPEAMNFKTSFDSSKLTAGSTTADSAVIQIPDGNGGYIYYYYDQAADFDWSKDPPEIPGWVRLGEEGEITPDTIPPCAGFWMKNPGGNVDITFTK